MFIEEEVKDIQYGVDYVKNKTNLPGQSSPIKPFKLYQASESEVINAPLFPKNSSNTHINTESDDPA